MAFGLYLAPAGWWTWLLGAAVVAAGVGGVVLRRGWARGTLWLGLGLVLGMALRLVIDLVQPESPGLFPLT